MRCLYPYTFFSFVRPLRYRASSQVKYLELWNEYMRLPMSGHAPLQRKRQIGHLAFFDPVHLMGPNTVQSKQIANDIAAWLAVLSDCGISSRGQSNTKLIISCCKVTSWETCCQNCVNWWLFLQNAVWCWNWNIWWPVNRISPCSEAVYMWLLCTWTSQVWNGLLTVDARFLPRDSRVMFIFATRR